MWNKGLFVDHYPPMKSTLCVWDTDLSPDMTFQNFLPWFHSTTRTDLISRVRDLKDIWKGAMHYHIYHTERFRYSFPVTKRQCPRISTEGQAGGQRKSWYTISRWMFTKFSAYVLNERAFYGVARTLARSISKLLSGEEACDLFNSLSIQCQQSR